MFSSSIKILNKNYLIYLPNALQRKVYESAFICSNNHVICPYSADLICKKNFSEDKWSDIILELSKKKVLKDSISTINTRRDYIRRLKRICIPKKIRSDHYRPYDTNDNHNHQKFITLLSSLPTKVSNITIPINHLFSKIWTSLSRISKTEPTKARRKSFSTRIQC